MSNYSKEKCRRCGKTINHFHGVPKEEECWCLSVVKKGYSKNIGMDFYDEIYDGYGDYDRNMYIVDHK